MLSTLYYDYFRCNLKEYVGVDFPITAVIFYLTIGLILATFFIYVQNRTILYALKRLYKHKCLDEESAQTIEELHLTKHKFILHMLKGQSMLSHYVRRVPTRTEEDENTPVLLRKVDFRTDKFYLDENYFTRSKAIIDRGEEPISHPLLSSLCFLVVFLILFFTMPSILSLLF
ncbi:MAG: hypothetical protein IKC72_03530 [Clostridia bacterium]|nr:hypothetical protein [Clostridia bacterium]